MNIYFVTYIHVHAYTVCILMHDAILLAPLIITLQMYLFAFKAILYQS